MVFGAGGRIVDVCVLGGAEMKSSNSSSSAVAAVVCLLVVENFGGIAGGTSSSPNEKRSSGSGFGSSTFLDSFLGVVVDLRRLELVVGLDTPPSSYSSYSSKRSLLEVLLAS